MSELTILKDKITSNVMERFIELTDKTTFDTELSFALQHIKKNPQLSKATLESNVMAVLNVAQTGLSLNPTLKYAYLVPRSVNKGGQWMVETCLEPSYIGLCKLVTDSGSARSIVSHLVYEGDEFEVSLGTSVDILHKPKFKTKEVTHVYVVSVLSDGSKLVDVMTKSDVDDIKERSESYKAHKAGKIKSCVWVSDFGEMARKTVIRRGIKYLPKTDMWDKIGQAINLDESDYKISYGQIDMIESLLMNAEIPHEEQSDIHREINTMSASRAREVIEYLQQHQLDPIRSGNNYNATDIKEHIDKIENQ
ncbi:MAG: hypothetical protein CMB97_08100 [Flavobacteriaceae bacterium]|nr:hypothetical protein [Flavobacteriaceae bacterium]